METIYATPSLLPAYVQREVTHSVHRAALGMGLRNGPVHAEVRINDKGSFVIELAARSIGGLCSRVLRFGDGITLEELILRQAIGEDISNIQRERSAAAVMMIPIPKSGMLKSINGVDEAKAVPASKM
ncbi:MAG: ATP-grasp domain-containing protein [Calditrichia bacterium]